MTSVYDVKINSWDDQEDFLAKYKGKVTLITNTTAACGNAPQFAILEDLYQKYKDQGFEVVGIPTNQFCGPKVTYGEWESEGISCAQDSRDHAHTVYGATFDFAELVVAKAGAPWDGKIPEGSVPHPLFEELTNQDGTNALMYGNFEKWLVDRDGKVLKRYTNGTLLDFAHDAGQEDFPTAEEAYNIISSDIEKALAA